MKRVIKCSESFGIDVKEFYDTITDKWGNLEISNRRHADAPYPPYDEHTINVSEIEYELRPKYVEAKFAEGNPSTIKIEWICQEDVWNEETLENEIRRYMNQRAKDLGLDEIFNVELYLQSRDGGDPYISKFEISDF